MSAFLHQKRISAILIAVVTIGCGILFLFYGVEAAAVICRFAGILLALIGAFYIFSFIIAKRSASSAPGAACWPASSASLPVSGWL